MKKRIIDIFSSLTLLVGAAVCVASCATECDENGVPMDYAAREQFLDIDFESYNIENVDLTQILIPISASSAWTVTSSESWAKPTKVYFMGETELILNLELNRAEERSTTITITMNTANETFVDSFNLVQGVSYAAEFIAPTTLSVSDEGGVTPLELSYNYGLIATVVDGEEWISFEGDASTVTLDGDSKEVALKSATLPLYFDECGMENREAIVLFTSTENPELTSTLVITQLAKIDPVTKFVDDFSESNASNSGSEFIPNPKMNWRIQNLLESVTFKHYYWVGNASYVYPWTNMLAYNTNAETEAYLILPPFDATKASEKTFSFWLGTSAGTVDNTAGGGSKLELVYSTDFKGDAFAGEGTWTVLQDYTFTGVVTNVLPKTCYEVPLDGFADQQNLTLALRYTGGTPSIGYRIDNIRLGVAPQENQDQDTGDQYEN